MTQPVLFQITTINEQNMLPQVRAALEKRTELIGRRQYPRLWRIADFFNGRPKVSAQKKKARRRFYIFLAVIDWFLSMVLLMPGLMEPEKLFFPALVGACAYGASVAILWRNQKVVLAVLSLLQGVLLCFGALANPKELGCFLLLGIAGLVIGILAIALRKHKKKNPFDRPARQFLHEQQSILPEHQLRVRFTDTAMSLFQEGSEPTAEVPYSAFECVIETEDLFLLTYQGKITVLQKGDIAEGSGAELSTQFKDKTPLFGCILADTAC